MQRDRTHLSLSCAAVRKIQTQMLPSVSSLFYALLCLDTVELWTRSIRTAEEKAHGRASRRSALWYAEEAEKVSCFAGRRRYGGSTNADMGGNVLFRQTPCAASLRFQVKQPRILPLLSARVHISEVRKNLADRKQWVDVCAVE
jgi:hypothetical protein